MASKGVTAAQLTEWGVRGRKGQVQTMVHDDIFDDPGFNGISTDAQYLAVVRRNIWASAKLIGSGSY
jgi:hypothetical protein